MRVTLFLAVAVAVLAGTTFAALSLPADAQRKFGAVQKASRHPFVRAVSSTRKQMTNPSLENMLALAQKLDHPSLDLLAKTASAQGFEVASIDAFSGVSGSDSDVSIADLCNDVDGQLRAAEAELQTLDPESVEYARCQFAIFALNIYKQICPCFQKLVEAEESGCDLAVFDQTTTDSSSSSGGCDAFDFPDRAGIELLCDNADCLKRILNAALDAGKCLQDKFGNGGNFGFDTSDSSDSGGSTSGSDDCDDENFNILDPTQTDAFFEFILTAMCTKDDSSGEFCPIVLEAQGATLNSITATTPPTTMQCEALRDTGCCMLTMAQAAADIEQITGIYSTDGVDILTGATLNNALASCSYDPIPCKIFGTATDFLTVDLVVDNLASTGCDSACTQAICEDMVSCLNTEAGSDVARAEMCAVGPDAVMEYTDVSATGPTGALVELEFRGEDNTDTLGLEPIVQTCVSGALQPTNTAAFADANPSAKVSAAESVAVDTSASTYTAGQTEAVEFSGSSTTRASVVASGVAVLAAAALAVLVF